MATKAADLLMLRGKRFEAARRADELADLYEKYPGVEIKRAMEIACDQVDAFDALLESLGKCG